MFEDLMTNKNALYSNNKIYINHYFGNVEGFK